MTRYIYICVYSVGVDSNISQGTKHTLNHSYWKVSVFKYMTVPHIQNLGMQAMQKKETLELI